MQAAAVHTLMIALILAPLAGVILCFVFPRAARQWGLFSALVNTTLAVALIGSLSHARRHALGGWGAPLGIDLYVDGLSALMLAMTAVVGLGISGYAAVYFSDSPDKQRKFWPLWLWLWTGLNALFLSADIFNLYVTLELVGLSAVALTALAGKADALRGAMRYLLVSLLGSLIYLLGVALLYHGYQTVDIALLGERIAAGPVTLVALGLMSAGLVLKTALFPLHFWLPPAHASAASPVSALLSAIVVKASFYILLRLWLNLFSDSGAGAEWILGMLGAGAVLWGSLQALRQTRLKLLIAYSTVAQLGYLFIGFPLAAAIGSQAWLGVIYLAFSHSLAKAAMFMAAGNIMRFGNHDRIADLDRVGQRLPVSLAAFGIAGVSITGLPPSGGFIGKWLLLEAATGAGQWLWAGVILVGGVLAAAYIFKVVGFAFTQAKAPHAPAAVPHAMEWVALLLAIGAVVLGLVVPPVLGLLDTGAPFAAFQWTGRT